MSIAFDNSTSNSQGGNVSSFSFNHVVGSGSNRILFVGTTFRGGTALHVTAVTYNGVSMTQIGSTQSATNAISNMWYLISPATGTNAVAVTLSGTGNTTNCIASSYTGALQSGVPDAQTGNTGSGTSITPTITTIANGCWTVLNIGSDVGSPVIASGIGIVRQNPSSIQSFFDSNSSIIPAGSTSFNISQSSANYSYQMASFAPSTPPVGSSGMFLVM